MESIIDKRIDEYRELALKREEIGYLMDKKAKALCDNIKKCLEQYLVTGGVRDYRRDIDEWVYVPYKIPIVKYKGNDAYVVKVSVSYFGLDNSINITVNLLDVDPTLTKKEKDLNKKFWDTFSKEEEPWDTEDKIKKVENEDALRKLRFTKNSPCHEVEYTLNILDDDHRGYFNFLRLDMDVIGYKEIKWR